MYCNVAHVPAMRAPGLRLTGQLTEEAKKIGGHAPGTRDTRAGVHTADPVGVDVVLEAAQSGILVHDNRITLPANSVSLRTRPTE